MKISTYSTVDRYWAFVIIFINGWLFALPNTEESLPIWLKPVQLIHGVFIHELLLIFYLIFLILSYGGKLPIRQHGGRNIAFLIIGLGSLGILSNAVNIQSLREMGESGRFFLLAVYFLLAIHWTKKHGPTFVLRALLLGIACSGAINVYYAFIIRRMELGGLPFLLGQNGPGGPLGLSVILSAWLMLERKTKVDAVIALASCFIGIIGVSISYSRLSMLIAGFGLIAWVCVLLVILTTRQSRRQGVMALVLLLAIAFVNHKQVSQYLEGVGTFVDRKFSDILTRNHSIETRSQYFIITAEVMFRNPFFGVGYGGFYDAAMATDASKSSRSNEEDAEKGGRGYSNPHNTFLYYASANGFIGLLLSMVLFIMTVGAFWRTLSIRGVSGRVLWVCLAIGYLIYGMTLPTLFNTSVLYLPAAVSIALASHARSCLSSIQSRGTASIHTGAAINQPYCEVET